MATRRSRITARPNVVLKSKKADSNLPSSTATDCALALSDRGSEETNEPNATNTPDHGCSGDTRDFATVINDDTPFHVANKLKENIESPISVAGKVSGKDCESVDLVPDIASEAGNDFLSHRSPVATTLHDKEAYSDECARDMETNSIIDLLPASTVSAGNQPVMDQPSSNSSARPRGRLKVRPNIADSSRTKLCKPTVCRSVDVHARQKKTSIEDCLSPMASSRMSRDTAIQEELQKQPSHMLGLSLEHREVPLDPLDLPSSPTKERMRRKQRRKTTNSSEPVDRSKMTMKELLYWNPTANPMVKGAGQMCKASTKIPALVINEKLPPSTNSYNSTAHLDLTAADGQDGVDPVPQIMISEDGQIILNESSLFVESGTNQTADLSTEIEVEDHQNYVTSASFRKRTCTKFWSTRETANFYKALNFVGTDFSMMNNLFRKRTRAELKNKFKKEEKLNKKKVDAALRGELKFDALAFSDSEDDKEERLRRAKITKKLKNKNADSSTTALIRPMRKYQRKALYNEDYSSDSSQEDQENAASPIKKSSMSTPANQEIKATKPTAEVRESSRHATGTSRQSNACHVVNTDAYAFEPHHGNINSLSETEPLKHVEAGQLIFVVPDHSPLSHMSDQPYNDISQQQQIIHVYMVSPPHGDSCEPPPLGTLPLLTGLRSPPPVVRLPSQVS